MSSIKTLVGLKRGIKWRHAMKYKTDKMIKLYGRFLWYLLKKNCNNRTTAKNYGVQLRLDICYDCHDLHSKHLYI